MNRILQAWQTIKDRYRGQTGLKGLYKLSKDVLYVKGLQSILTPKPESPNSYDNRPVFFINVDSRIREDSIVIPSGDHGRLLQLRSGKDGTGTSDSLLNVILRDAPIQPAEAEMEAAAPDNPLLLLTLLLLSSFFTQMNRIREAWQAIKGRFRRLTGLKGVYNLSKDVMYVKGLISILTPKPEPPTSYDDRPVFFINVDSRIREDSIVIPSGDHGRLLQLRSGKDGTTGDTLLHVIIRDAPIEPAEAEMEAAAAGDPPA